MNFIFYRTLNVNCKPRIIHHRFSPIVILFLFLEAIEKLWFPTFPGNISLHSNQKEINSWRDWIVLVSSFLAFNNSISDARLWAILLISFNFFLLFYTLFDFILSRIYLFHFSSGVVFFFLWYRVVKIVCTTILNTMSYKIEHII